MKCLVEVDFEATFSFWELNMNYNAPVCELSEMKVFHIGIRNSEFYLF